MPAPLASADLVDATVEEICLVAAPCWVESEAEVCDWTWPSALWPELTPLATALLACEAIDVMFDIAPGSVDLIAVAASLPLASKAEPTLPPWLWTPETTCPPWDWTLPAVSPETLEATFALPSAAASLAPPPPPDWPWTAPAVESMFDLTFWLDA